MDIKLDSEAVRDIAAKAILDSLSNDQRALVLKQAIAGLLKEPELGYGRKGSSPLAEAFQNAVNAAARGIVGDYISQPEVAEQIRVGVIGAVQKLMEDRWLYGAIGDAVGWVVTETLEKREY